ncbi:MAG: ligase-associated DNA damage response endonuclease PdeM [Anditalea sp.]
MDFYYKEERIQLLPEKAAYLPQQRILLIADIHLGKASHFRKEGIIIPAPEVSPDLGCINELIHTLTPQTIVFLGDLFHSKFNSEWIGLKKFLAAHPDIRFYLTKGNHDILPASIMEDAPIEVVKEFAVGQHILCTHEPLKDIPEGILNIAGHVHPGILVKSKSRQHYRLPCFYHHRQLLLVPAFGHLTGLHLLEKEPGARIFPVLPTEVIEWIQTGEAKNIKKHK